MENKELVNLAYLKLKSYVYFDKTVSFLRDKIVSFESAKDFKNKLQNIVDLLDSKENSIKLLDNILNSIGFLAFPKTMSKTPQSDEYIGRSELFSYVIGLQNPNEKSVIENIQYFIDMDIEGHILGIIWILLFGEETEKKCCENSYGNRLRKKLVWNEDGVPIEGVPALFEPYFGQYSTWRDKGLSCAEFLLKQKHDVLLITLDLKSFYYNTGITEEKFNELDKKEDIIKTKLHSFVLSILEKYTLILKEKTEHTKINGIALPIGFLPSPVLANWCLQNFDKGILDYWNPAYYGKYVDDIIIVEKIEKDSEIYNKLKCLEGTSKQEIIEYYLCGERFKNEESFKIPCFADKVLKPTNEQSADIQESAENKAIPKSSNEKPIEHNGENGKDKNKKEKDIEYRVKNEFSLTEKSNFIFQWKKVRITALFTEKHNDILISKLRGDIQQNSSEFRFLPNIEEYSLNGISPEIFRIENDETVNKLRGIKNISLKSIICNDTF